MHVHVIEYSVVTQCITGHKTRIGNEASDGYCLPVVFAKQQLENGNVKHARVFKREIIVGDSFFYIHIHMDIDTFKLKER